MFGPLDHNQNKRAFSWVESVNVIFVDSPIGTGFSVFDNETDIPDSVEEISLDLIEMLKVFMEEHPHYRTSPFYIFGQSYGGKMTAALAFYLQKAIEAKEIQCNLKAAAIGNGWVSPTDIMLSWPGLLFQMSLIDDVQYKNLSTIACDAWLAGEKQDWGGVADGWKGQFQFFSRELSFLNMYNVLDPYEMKDTDRKKRSTETGMETDLAIDLGFTIYDINISDFMNGPIRQKLKVIPESKIWGTGKRSVREAQERDYDLYKPVWSLLDRILQTSEVQVIVYQGQLDLICATSGVLAWMQRLTWPGKQNFDAAEREVLANPGEV